MEKHMNFIDQLIVVKVYPTRSSHSIPGSEYIEVALMDPHDDYKYYHTYISDQLDNYARWKQFFDDYDKDTVYMLSGHFRKKAPGRTSTGAKDLINGDAKFYVTNSCSVEDMHGFLKHELGEYA
tara:strand:- start:155 stop:526 length:372 start_codon:yes stop_codon:yes gene_type:complete